MSIKGIKTNAFKYIHSILLYQIKHNDINEDFIYKLFPNSLTPSITKLKKFNYKKHGFKLDNENLFIYFIYGSLLGHEYNENPLSPKILKALDYWIKNGEQILEDFDLMNSLYDDIKNERVLTRETMATLIGMKYK